MIYLENALIGFTTSGNLGGTLLGATTFMPIEESSNLHKKVHTLAIGVFCATKWGLDQSFFHEYSVWVMLGSLCLANKAYLSGQANSYAITVQQASIQFIMTSIYTTVLNQNSPFTISFLVIWNLLAQNNTDLHERNTVIKKETELKKKNNRQTLNLKKKVLTAKENEQFAGIKLQISNLTGNLVYEENRELNNHLKELKQASLDMVAEVEKCFKENTSLRRQLYLLKITNSKPMNELFDEIDKLKVLWYDHPIMKNYKCPISYQIPENPVTEATNPKQFYEKEALVEWVKNNKKSPSTNQPLKLDQIIELPKLKELLDWCRENPFDKPSKELLEAAKKEQEEL